MTSSVAPAKTFIHLEEDEAYACTSFAEWQLIVTQMENFETLKVEDIEPENRFCEICFEPFGPFDDGSPSEEPVQLLGCGHVFGHVCISHWLAQFMPQGKWWYYIKDSYLHSLSDRDFRSNEATKVCAAINHTDFDNVGILYHEDRQLRRDWRDILNWNTDYLEDLLPASMPWFGPELRDASCPKCRGEFLILRSGLMGVKVEAHLHFWDRLYEKLGISRSPKEEQSRNDLMRYVQMVQVQKMEIQPEDMRSFTLQAQVSAMRFALRRGNRALDSPQTYLNIAIFNLGCYGIHEGEYDAVSYETLGVPLWCYQVDRIERGLNPRMLPVVRHRNWNLVDYHREFYLEHRRQIFGPWRRTLFAEVGGDRDGIRWNWEMDRRSRWDPVKLRNG